MRLAQIEAGIVINVIVVDPADIPPWCVSWPVCADAGPGWLWDGETFSPPAEPETP